MTFEQHKIALEKGRIFRCATTAVKAWMGSISIIVFDSLKCLSSLSFKILGLSIAFYIDAGVGRGWVILSFGSDAIRELAGRCSY